MSQHTDQVLSPRITIKLAERADLVWAQQLYFEVYEGSYHDPMVSNYQNLMQYVSGKNSCFGKQDPTLKHHLPCQFMVVAKLDHGMVVGAVRYNYDPNHLFAKVYGAVVHPDYRGQDLTERLMQFGVEQIEQNTPGLDLVYATTRTVHKGAQILTERQGYKKLGIFPNVHKTQLYETHGLVVLFRPQAFSKRYLNFQLHPKLEALYKIAQREANLPNLSIASLENIKKKNYSPALPVLETIFAPHYVRYRLQHRMQTGKVDLAFFPFHEPTVVISSADQNIEVFCTLNQEDGHCAIIGAHVGAEICYTALFKKVSNILRDLGVRYIEIITRADRVSIIDSIMKANFIPCAYFPAFQLREDKRLDYVIFSRSFEIFDFYNVQLNGANKDYLRQYYQSWQEIALGPKLWDN